MSLPAGYYCRASGRADDFARRDVTSARGFTLIEVMLASVVLVLAITTSILTLQRGFQAIDTARNYTYASQLMQSEMERIRLDSWSQLQSLQDSGNTTVVVPIVAGATTSLACFRTIRDIKQDMKEITLNTTWVGHDGRPHNATYITRYSKSGLYDYFYTAH